MLLHSEASVVNDDVSVVKQVSVLSRSERCPSFFMHTLHHDGFNVIKSKHMLLMLCACFFFVFWWDF